MSGDTPGDHCGTVDKPVPSGRGRASLQDGVWLSQPLGSVPRAGKHSDWDVAPGGSGVELMSESPGRSRG